MAVLREQAVALRLDGAVGAERLGDHRRDDRKELRVGLVVAVGVEGEVDGERAGRLPLEKDGNADQAPLGRARATLEGAVHHQRFPSGGRDHDRPPALHHLADYTFADLVSGAKPVCGNAHRGLDADLDGRLVEEEDGGADGAAMLLELLEHPLERAAQLGTAGEGLSNLGEDREETDVRACFAGCCHGHGRTVSSTPDVLQLGRRKCLALPMKIRLCRIANPGPTSLGERHAPATAMRLSGVRTKPVAPYRHFCLNLGHFRQNRAPIL